MIMIKVEVTQPSSIGQHKNTNTKTINKSKNKKSKNFIDIINKDKKR